MTGAVYLKEFPKPLSAIQERKYLEEYAAGDRNARNILIEHNLRLVAHIIKKYSIHDRDVEDLLSIGTIGLIKAIDSFDSAKGIRLATYASRCIENELLMMMRNEKKNSKDVYLYETIGTDKEGNEISLIDVIESDTIDIVDKINDQRMVSKIYSQIKEVLSDRELEIIIKRYGLDGSDGMTQNELAKTLGISRSYVSRIEKKALEKLRTIK